MTDAGNVAWSAALEWVREGAGVYHSVRLDGERVFYRLVRKGRRWRVERVALRLRRPARAERIGEAPTLAYARFVAACDLVSGAGA